MSDTAHPALHFIENQQRAHFIAPFTQRRQELPAEVDSTRESLHGLDDDGRRLVRDKSGDRINIAARYETDFERGAREAVPLLPGAPRDGSRRGRTAVKAAYNGRDLRSRSQSKCHLEGVFVGLGTAVDEEHARNRQLGKTYEPLGCARADLHRHCIRLEVARLRLVGERTREARMSVAQRGDRVSAIQIEYTLAAAVGKPDTLAGDHFNGILRKHRRKKIMAGRCRPGSWNRWVHGRSLQVHPGAGAVRPEVSARPNIRFIHCTAPPAAPLFKLSTTHMTATVLPFATADRCA
jgi:hypothetical protein